MKQNQDQLRRIHVHNSAVYSLAVSKCQRFLASCSQDGTVHVFNKQFQVISSFSHPQTIRSVTFSDNPTRLFAACYDRNIYVYIEEDGETEAFRSYNMLQNAHAKEIKSISACRDLLASCSRDRAVQVYRQSQFDVFDFDCVAALQEHQQDIKCVSFDQRSAALISCGYDNVVRLYLPKWTGDPGEEPELEYQEEAASVSTAAPDESKEIPLEWFFTPDKIQELQDALNQQKQSPELNTTVWSGEIISHSNTGTTIVVGDAAGNVSILKKKDNALEVVKQIHWHLGDCYSVKIVQKVPTQSENVGKSQQTNNTLNQLILTAGADGRVLCLDGDLQAHFELRGLHQGQINCAVAFNGSVVTAGDDGVICVISGMFD